MEPWAQSSEARFVEYVDALTTVLGRADRARPLKDYCIGLLMPGERKNVEPISAPARVSAKHQLLVDDHLLEMSYDALPSSSEKPISPADRRSKSLSIVNFERWVDPNSSACNTILALIDVLHEENASSREAFNNPAAEMIALPRSPPMFD